MNSGCRHSRRARHTTPRRVNRYEPSRLLNPRCESVPVLVEPGKPYVSRLDRAEARHLHPAPGMRSYASIKGHPLHPMLINYPFAFLTGAFAFGLAARAARRGDLQLVS